MNYAQIRNYDVANGEGIRVSLFVSGCKHNCYNCFNKEYQDFKYGDVWTYKQAEELQSMLEHKRIRGLSLLGGEPIEHPKELAKLIDSLSLRKDQDIWLWSGYTFEQILRDKTKTELLKRLDVLVDGLYIEKLKDLNLRFRGSSNQRIIDVRKSLETGEVVLKYS